MELPSSPAVLNTFSATQPVIQTGVRHIIQFPVYGNRPTIYLVYADSFKRVNATCVFAHGTQPFPSVSFEICIEAIPVKSRNKLFRMELVFADGAKIVWSDAFKLTTAPSPPRIVDEDLWMLTLEDFADLFVAANDTDIDVMSGSGIIELDDAFTVDLGADALTDLCSAQCA